MSNSKQSRASGPSRHADCKLATGTFRVQGFLRLTGWSLTSVQERLVLVCLSNSGVRATLCIAGRTVDTNNAPPPPPPETQRKNGNETVAAEFAEVTNDVECFTVKEPRMMNQIRELRPLE
jgi:hypothetical protein